MSTSLSRRFRAPAVFLAFALLALATLAMRPAVQAGPHMSPHLTFVQGPAVASVKSAVHHDCLFAVFGLSCYGPADLAQAYNFPAGLDGTGQTILIVDAYGSPSMASDLALFDGYYGIAAPPSLTIINVPGTGVTGSGGLVGWQVETSLDVEYAHAMAPGAKIVLAVAATDNNFDLNAAEAAVFPLYPGAIVSQSFGDWETDATAGNSFAQEHQIFKQANELGDTLLAASGDWGATWTQIVGTQSPVLASYPASDPLVTSVGGTMGNPYPDGLLTSGGTYGGEQTWNEPQAGFDAATGGAPSILFRAPSWQRGDTGFRTRTIPDVAYNASINGGVQVFASPFIYLVGGTSCGSPQWAAIIALANQARHNAGRDNLGFANRTLYRLGEAQHKGKATVYHDITIGNNALDSPLGFAAGPGYDLVTGWGTPNVANLVAALSVGNSDRGTDEGSPSNGRGDQSGNAAHVAGTMSHN